MRSLGAVAQSRRNRERRDFLLRHFHCETRLAFNRDPRASGQRRNVTSRYAKRPESTGKVRRSPGGNETY